MSVVTVGAVFGVLAAWNEMWLLVASLLFFEFIVCVLTLLLVARYLSHNARTGERSSKKAVQNLSARVKQSMIQQEEARALQDAALSQMRQDQHEIERAMEKSRERFDRVEYSVSGLANTLERSAKTNRQQLTRTIRDGTRQTESSVHIFQRYPEVKLPMPSTGGFAIDSQALAHLLSLVEERRPRRILELGSGTTTIWLGYLSKKIGGKVVSLDHLEHYLNLTRSAVNRHELGDVVETRLAPLEPIECDGRSFDWYSLAAMADLSQIDMLIVDGPPAATGPKARYPSLPELFHLLAPHATVILDDAHRDDETEIVDAWLENYPEFTHIERGTSRLAVLQRGHTNSDPV